MQRRLIFASLALLAAIGMGRAAAGQDRDTKVRNDRRDVVEEGFWIYNDLPAGLEQARVLGKPLMVVFRCVT